MHISIMKDFIIFSFAMALWDLEIINSNAFFLLFYYKKKLKN